MIKDINCKFLLFSLFLLTGSVYSESRLPSLPEINKKELPSKILNYQEDSGKNLVLRDYASKELNIVQGKPETPHLSLLNNIDRTCTLYGYEALKVLLENPLDNKEKLVNRQSLIKRLKESPELLEEFTETLNTVAQNQENVLRLWSTSDSISKKSDTLKLVSQLMGLNYSKYGVESIRQGMNLSAASIATILSYFTLKYTRILHKKYFNPILIQNKNGWICEQINKRDVVIPLIGGVLTSVWCYKIFPAIIKQEKNSLEIQELLMGVSNTLRAANDLKEALDKVSTSKDALEYINYLNSYTEDVSLLSRKIQRLVSELKTETFNGKPSYLSFMGKVRVIYDRVAKLKNSLIPLLKAIGEIDAYVSAAKLIVEHESKPVHYCITEFVDSVDPMINLKASWNPLVKSENVITADIALGTGEGLIPNILLTGPHGGGKSSFMKQLAYSIILSQVFGISVADACQSSIFSSINTYLDIRDDVEKSMSAFMSERDRIQELKRRIQGLNETRFGFTLIDEPFKATMEKEASKLVINFIKKIEQVTENICVTASHFIEPANDVDEREQSRFVNFHMDTRERTSGRFKRFFKLNEGKCQWWFSDSEKRERYVKWLQTVLY